MPWSIINRDGKYCVIKDEDGSTEACHGTRSEAVKHQRALYASEEASADKGTMKAVDGKRKIPVKDVALLHRSMAKKDSPDPEKAEEVPLTQALADQEVAAQTVALIGHLADRLRTAELNQAALVDVLQAATRDSNESRMALLEAISAISSRLSEPPQVPQVHITVPAAEPPVVHVHPAEPTRKTVELERDDSGRLIGAVVEEEK